MHLITKSISLILLCNLQLVASLRILGVFPYEGKSHFFVFKTLLDELVGRGHDLTVISQFPKTKPVTNYRDIALESVILEDAKPLLKESLMETIDFMIAKGVENCKLMLSNEEVQELWITRQKFDLVITEQFNSGCSLALAHKLGAPVVGLSSTVLPGWYYDKFGLRMNIYDNTFTKTLAFRAAMEGISLYADAAYNNANKKADVIIAQYFDSPPLEVLEKNVKLMLLYTYFPLTGVKLSLPNLVEVGGYHVAQAKSLVGELKKFVEEAPHGVVYVSFGSLVKSATLAEDKLQAIIGALSQLKQRVIWKWEDKTLPGNPKNILPMRWLPQNDILAHPNVLAFYSHAGMLGTTEAIHHGVPMVAMPILGDQPSNAAAIRECGLGVYLDFNDVTTETLLAALSQVLQPEFRAKAKDLSRMWHDRPLSAMDTAIFWTEFAARHSNFSFRSPAADVPFYKYYSLDLFAVFMIPVFLIFFVLLKCCWRDNKDKKRVKKD